MENISLQKLTTEVYRLAKIIDTYEAQKAIKIQLKKDYINIEPGRQVYQIPAGREIRNVFICC